LYCYIKENYNVDKVFDYLVDQWSKAPEDADTTPAVDIATMAASAPGAGPRALAPAAVQKPAGAGEEGGKAFKIDKPSTQRTGGKKKLSKRLTSSCSLV
jgi:hypothetical protein